MNRLCLTVKQLGKSLAKATLLAWLCLFAQPVSAAQLCPVDYTHSYENQPGNFPNANATAFAALKSDGSIFAWGKGQYGGNGEPSDSGYVSITANRRAFAALKADGSITAWGSFNAGGGGAPIDDGYTSITNSIFAFAALKSDGSISVWGLSSSGGTGAPVDTNYVSIHSSQYAFAALKADGSVSVWGDSSFGGTGGPSDSGYVSISSNQKAFAALKADGSIFAWGDTNSGGMDAPTEKGYVLIASTALGFAALKADGSITAWGGAGSGGTGAPSDTGYVSISSTQKAFAAFKADGSITAWGPTGNGGTDAPSDNGYVSITANSTVFAALKPDGSIFTWGNNNNGGTGEPTESGYVSIAASHRAFAALKADGSITAWGNDTYGGSGAPSGTGYLSISSTSWSFAALSSDGSISTWGRDSYGGSGGPTDNGYSTISGRGPAQSEDCAASFRLNLIPSIMGTPASSVLEDTFYSFAPVATDADGSIVSYSILNIPAWASFNSITGVLSGTPDNSHVGSSSTITLWVTDNGGASNALADFSITVVNVNDAPTTAGAIAAQSAVEDTAFNFVLPDGLFEDIDDGDVLSYSTSNLPAWLSFDAFTRTFSGTPSSLDNGELFIAVYATDSEGAATSSSFVLTAYHPIDGSVVAKIVASVALLNSPEGARDSRDFSTALAELDTVPAIPEDILDELAALIDRTVPSPTTKTEITELATKLLIRASEHPVLSLRIEQGGTQVQKVRTNGGTVTVIAHLANSVPGATIAVDWSLSDEILLDAGSSPNPVLQSFSFDPSALLPSSALKIRLSLSQNNLIANGELGILVAPLDTTAENTRDKDGDGVLDIFEGELEASSNPEAANKLQVIRGKNFDHVMESEAGTTLRLGAIARAAQNNQVDITLADMITHSSDVTIENAYWGLPNNTPALDSKVFDFEVAILPHAGSSTLIMLPLQYALRADASYKTFSATTSWRDFIQDGLNRVSSAPALAGVIGQCPPVGHETFTTGLSAGNACLQLLIEDGGLNDSDRWASDGSLASDNGLNGNIKGPSAIVYDTVRPQLTTALTGTGSIGFGWLVLVVLLFFRNCRKAKRIAATALLRTALLLNVFFPSTVLAIEPTGSVELKQGWYVGIGMGSSQLKPGSNSDELRVSTDRGNGISGRIGLDINNRFTVEAYTSKLGSVDLSLQGNAAGSIGYNAYGFRLLTYIHHQNFTSTTALSNREGLSYFMNLGFGRLQNSTDQIDIHNMHNSYLELGLGLEYGWKNNFALRASYSSYDKDASEFSLSLLKRFGQRFKLSPIHAASTAGTPVIKPIAVRLPNDSVVLFDTGEISVSIREYEQIQRLIAVLQDHPNIQLKIESHSDSIGSAEDNLALSIARSVEVRNILMYFGIAPERLSSQDFGESRAMNDNENEQGRAKNRRVEISLAR